MFKRRERRKKEKKQQNKQILGLSLLYDWFEVACSFREQVGFFNLLLRKTLLWEKWKDEFIEKFYRKTFSTPTIDVAIITGNKGDQSFDSQEVSFLLWLWLPLFLCFLQTCVLTPFLPIISFDKQYSSWEKYSVMRASFLSWQMALHVFVLMRRKG